MQVTGIDRNELRRRNLIKPEALPYHTPTHQNYDSGDFHHMMDHEGTTVVTNDNIFVIGQERVVQPKYPTNIRGVMNVWIEPV